MTLSRRTFLTALPAGLAALGLSLPPLRAQDLGLIADTSVDQSGILQASIDSAADAGRPVELPGGDFHVSGIRLKSGTVLRGVAHQTRLISSGIEPLLQASDATGLVLEDFTVDAGPLGPRPDDNAGLVSLSNCSAIALDRVRIAGGRANGLSLWRCGGAVEGCTIEGTAGAGLFSVGATGLRIAGNHVRDHGNGGILVWRYEAGYDGTIVTGNRISGIDWQSGGNGQYGNGINVFRAGNVIVADNQIADCAFSAIRLNSTDNTIVSGNMCRDSGEVALFSEFSFSGSIISDNLIDGAAAGISITNFDHDGHLATCSGNIVRGITPASRTNPDTRPYGISAQADVAVTGNTVEEVPGNGITAGWGPYLRNVSVSANVVSDCDIGIAVSVVEDAGPASVTGNIVSGSRRAGIAGMRWREIVDSDLQGGEFANASVAGNFVS